MSQSYSSNCFSTANVIETDMQNVENNFDALRSLFSGSSAPTSPDAGQLWYDTGSSSVKIRYNSSWVEWWDMDGQCVAAGQVKTASLAAGALSTDAAGRAKMANGYITNAHVADVDVSKVSNLNKNLVIFTAPNIWPGNSTGSYLDRVAGATAIKLGRIFIPNAGASKLKAAFFTGTNGGPISITIGSCTVNMGTAGATTYLDSSTYIDVTAYLGTVQTITVQSSSTGAINLQSVTIYLTT